MSEQVAVLDSSGTEFSRENPDMQAPHRADDYVVVTYVER